MAVMIDVNPDDLSEGVVDFRDVLRRSGVVFCAVTGAVNATTPETIRRGKRKRKKRQRIMSHLDSGKLVQ